MRTTSSHRYSSLSHLPCATLVFEQNLPFREHKYILGYDMRNTCNLLSFRELVAAVAASIQDCDAVAALCVQRDTNAWKFSLLAYEKAAGEVGGAGVDGGA